jgi:flagellar basal-body rod protein FlgB
MDALSAALIVKSLDGLSARAAATAENIANGNSQGYRPVRVTFEDSLARAMAGGPAAVAAVTPKLEMAAAGDGLRLDLEMATASTTAQRYAALVDALSRELQLQAIATTGNG